MVFKLGVTAEKTYSINVRPEETVARLSSGKYKASRKHLYFDVILFIFSGMLSFSKL